MFGFHHVLFRGLFQRFALFVDSCLRGKGLFFKVADCNLFCRQQIVHKLAHAEIINYSPVNKGAFNYVFAVVHVIHLCTCSSHYTNTALH